jgi:hypothetical protein
MKFRVLVAAANSPAIVVSPSASSAFALGEQTGIGGQA